MALAVPPEDGYDVATVRFEVESQSGVTQSVEVSLEEEPLPAAANAELAGHRFASFYLVLEPGIYDVRAIPLAENSQPSRMCGEATGRARVRAGMTTEIFLISSCSIESSGGLGGVVVFNTPPYIEELIPRESSYICADEAAVLTAVVSDAQDDDIRYEYTVTGVPDGAGLNSYCLVYEGRRARFSAVEPGRYDLSLRVSDDWGFTRLSFPIYVSDCGADPICPGAAIGNVMQGRGTVSAGRCECGCGDGEIDPAAGEECDGPGTCGDIGVCLPNCTCAPLPNIQHYYAQGERIPVNVLLNQVGVVAVENTRIDDIEVFVEPFGLQITRAIPDDFYVLTLDEPIERMQLVRRIREIRRAGLAAGLLRDAGLIITEPSDRNTPIFTPDQFIVLFNDDVTPEQIEAFNVANGVEVVGPDAFVDNQYLLSVAPDTDLDVLTMSNLYEENDLVSFAHPNFWTLEQPMETLLNDALFNNQWHHRNTGQSGGLIDADADTSWAWDFGLGDPDIIIAVFDNGFDLTHEDLATNIYTNPLEIPGNGIDDDGNTFVDDVNGWDFGPCGAGPPAPGCGDNDPSPGGAGDNHGTAVAGVAAARGNNLLGVAGSCPDCTILPLRRTYGMFSEQAKANAFDYARVMGAQIMNNSWGHTNPAATVSTAVANAVNNAAAAGMLVFFAGGNGNTAGWCGASYPSLNNVFSVSSSTNYDLKVTESAFGNCIDVLAPSHRGYTIFNGSLNVTTTDRTGNAGYNNASPPGIPVAIAEPADRNYTHRFGGTSSASPFAAGIAGLLLSADPTLTRTDVQRLIQDTTDRIDPDVAAYDPDNGFSTPASGIATHSWGRTNAFEAARIAAPIAQGGKGRVDIFVRDNVLDWGNTTGYLGEQRSSTKFTWPARGFTGHWRSQDVKVDAPPYHAVPTAATFDNYADETPSAVPGDLNRAYVRVRNRGPDTANPVSVKLLWSQFGAALALLPPDFWMAFPNNSVDTSDWHPMDCTADGLSYCTLADVAYSGSSVANTGSDVAQIAQFDFPAPPIDAALDNHFCLLAIIDSPDDPIDPESMNRFVVDNITPNDNNVTHRNYLNLDSGADSQTIQFYVRNPELQRSTRVRIRLEDEMLLELNWMIMLSDDLQLGQMFTLEPGEQRLLEVTIVPPSPRARAEITLIQERFDEAGRPIVMGGLTLEFAPRQFGAAVDRLP